MAVFSVAISSLALYMAIVRKNDLEVASRVVERAREEVRGCDRAVDICMRALVEAEFNCTDNRNEEL